MTTIGDSISRVRNILKAVKEDPFLTDRLIYSIIGKYAKVLIRRQDNENKIMKFQSLFEFIPCVELIEVDKIEACCTGIKSKCTIRRTKDKLPQVLEGAYGPLFRTVSSIDGSTEMFKTYPGTYTSMTRTTNFKYNKNKYFWYLNGHLYFPNIEWDQVRVEGLWDGDIRPYSCPEDSDPCSRIQDLQLRIPEFLFAEIEQFVEKEFISTGQIPSDGPDDKQNVMR